MPGPWPGGHRGRVTVVAEADQTFVDSLVERLHRDYGADPDDVRGRAAAALATFAGARVRTFVPILVEKKLREAYRRR